MLYQIFWEDGSAFSKPVSLKEAQKMYKACCEFWGNFFEIREVDA